MTAEEWIARETLRNWDYPPTFWLRDSHRKFFLYFGAYLPRFMFGRMCLACQRSVPLFEEEAERKLTLDDWKQAMRAEHTSTFGRAECGTKRVFRLATLYLRGIICPQEFWNSVCAVAEEVAQQLRRQHWEDTAWEGTFRAERREIWHDGMRLLKELVGNPFRPVTFDPAWRTSDVMLLARGIYEDRAFDRMPILADALQDAGCDNPDILGHLREANATHVRGCWALDLALGKE